MSPRLAACMDAVGPVQAWFVQSRQAIGPSVLCHPIQEAADDHPSRPTAFVCVRFIDCVREGLVSVCLCVCVCVCVCMQRVYRVCSVCSVCLTAGVARCCGAQHPFVHCTSAHTAHCTLHTARSLNILADPTLDSPGQTASVVEQPTDLPATSSSLVFPPGPIAVPVVPLPKTWNLVLTRDKTCAPFCTALSSFSDPPRHPPPTPC